MVTRSSSSLRQMRSIPCYTKSLVSISAGTSCRSPASSVHPVFWWYIHRFRPKRFPSSSPMPRPIPASSPWRRVGSELPPMFSANCSSLTGVNLVHVPYRGAAPAVADLVAGQVQVYFDPIPNSIGYIRAGKVRPLAITSATRSEALPDVPTVSEFVPGYEGSFWFGVGAPKATPNEIVDKLNNGINAALADPKIKARLADLGGTVLAGSP